MRLSTEATRPDDARSIIDAAITAGVTLVDTADVYCHSDADLGHNERLLADLPPHVCIVTKGGLTRPDGAWVPNGRAKHLASAARASLARLGRIDLYLLHAIDPKVSLATSVRALARLVDEKIAPAIGLSNVNLTQLEAALAIAPIAAVEVELHPFKLDALRGGLVEACTRRGIELLAHRPFGGPRGVARLSRDAIVRAHATRLACTPAQLITAWLRSLSPMVTPLPGASRIETALEAAKVIELDETARSALDEHFVRVASRERWSSPDGAGDARRERGASSTERSASRETDVSSETNPSTETRASTETRTSNETGSKSHEEGAGRLSSSPAVSAPVESRSLRVDRPGEVVLVMGIPGAGKSTLASELASRGYLRLNRDDRGGSLVDLARDLDGELANGATRAVLDNTYPSRASRRPVIDIARRYGLSVRCVVVDTPIERAQHNAVLRMLDRHGRLLDPAELRGTDIGPGAQFRWRREYEPPREDEGFDAIEIVPFAQLQRARTSIGAEVLDASDVLDTHNNTRNALDTRYALDTREAQRAILIELDDVVWRGRPRAVEKVVLHEGARDALRAWHTAKHVIAATSWQPGVAPMKFAELVEQLARMLDVPLRASACFHMAGPPVCWCRKPLPGLALAMARHHELRFVVCVGSGAPDRGFAARAGVPYHDVRDGWPPLGTMSA